MATLPDGAGAYAGVAPELSADKEGGMKHLVLEMNSACTDQSPTFSLPSGGSVVMTPPIGEEYWIFRVKLSDRQAILGFPKFFTIGVGFAKEEDWNTNLPASQSAEAILAHIKHNKGDDSISDADCIRAIELVRSAALEILTRKNAGSA